LFFLLSKGYIEILGHIERNVKNYSLLFLMEISIKIEATTISNPKADPLVSSSDT